MFIFRGVTVLPFQQGQKCTSCIGIDVHQKILVCHLRDLRGSSIFDECREFRSFEGDLDALHDWVLERNPELILMESTGCYYQSVYDILEEPVLDNKAEFKIAVVNPRHVKGMQGKKTDESDASWLAQVGIMGGYTPSYIPNLKYRNLRAVSRDLVKLTQLLQSLKNRESKNFNLAGFRFNVVFSDAFGENARKAKALILTGVKPEDVVEQLQLNRLKSSKEDIVAALSGTLTPEMTFVLKSIHEQIIETENKIKAHIGFLKEKVLEDESDKRIFNILTDMPGWGEITALQFIVEVGGAEFVEAFSNCHKFASWLGVCPGNNESAGKRKSGRCRKGNAFLRRILCEVAQSAAHAKNTTFYGKYQSLVIRLKAKKSIFAIAHFIAKLVYHLVKNNEEYVEQNVDYRSKSCEKNARRWLNDISRYTGLDIVASDRYTGDVIISKADAKVGVVQSLMGIINERKINRRNGTPTQSP